VGGFPEDYELWLRLMDQGVRFSKVDEVILDWYDDASRLSRIHTNYDSESFFEIKTRYFFKWFRKKFEFKPRPILIWGAGKPVIEKSKYLEDYNLEIVGYIDVIRKKDHNINGKPVFFYEDIPGGVFILSYVSDRTGRQQIHEFLIKNNYMEGKDFYMMT
jgi:hypothetical protein